MDLLRRNSAGELAGVVGAAVVERDKTTRVHRFRSVAQQRLKVERPEVVKLIEVYTQGVNAGLKSLSKKPFEYILLGQEPAPWKPEDCMLVVFSMFMDLQSDQFRREVDRGVLHDNVPEPMYEFLMARGNKWDAPIHGEAFEVPAVPGPEVFDARKLRIAELEQAAADSLVENSSRPTFAEPYTLGSNNWAVSGKLTKDGRALVADDMHLRIAVPHIWYRARWVWTDADEMKSRYEMTGVSLPGTPAMIVGSNGSVAWGYTNTEGDWNDVVIVEPNDGDANTYKTADGPKAFEKHSEVIKVKDAKDVSLEVVSTIWGPVIEKDHKGRMLASKWVPYDVEGVNVNLIDMEKVKTVAEALDKANTFGIPHQNFVVGDTTGTIAWTIGGKIPRRFGHDGRLPQSWADGSKGWDGYLKPEEYPRVVNPQSNNIWTANARVVSGDFYKVIGDSGYDRGARQQQIRDRLLKLEKATEADMLDIQLDDRAVFLEPWQQLLLKTLSDDAIKGNAGRTQLRDLVKSWGGRAAVDSVGYRLVLEFRSAVVQQLSDMISQPIQKVDKRFTLARNRRVEGPFWKILEERPEHFLHPKFETWDAWLLSSVDKVIADATKGDKKLSEYTWGKANATRIQHPLSAAVPSLASWLDMPQQQLDGGWSDMPRIQAPSSGASQRMAVSPGREEDGYMQIPCGQSGHPLSPFYNNSHQDWATGKPTPFLPGAAKHTLELTP
ncbi:MAG: penicillin acylase family protein [Pirellulales bacterium]